MGVHWELATILVVNGKGNGTGTAATGTLRPGRTGHPATLYVSTLGWPGVKGHARDMQQLDNSNRVSRIVIQLQLDLTLVPYPWTRET